MILWFNSGLLQGSSFKICWFVLLHNCSLCIFCYMIYLSFVHNFCAGEVFVYTGTQEMAIPWINTYIDEQTIAYGVCPIVIWVSLQRFIFLGKVQRHRGRNRYDCAMQAETLGLGVTRSPSSMARKSCVSLQPGRHNMRLRVYNTTKGEFWGETLHSFLLGQSHAVTIGKPWR